ncbi:MAG: class I SAM-dependent methyltransferase [Bdellovibrionales bacterium]
MGQVNHWCRVVMNAETLRLIQGIQPEQKDVLEISGMAWRNMVPFKSYQSVAYPHIDICAAPLEGKKFDLVIAEQVFEHLQYPYRAGRNIYSMLNPGGYLLLTTPFMIKVHKSPLDCTRWTEDGLRFLMEECGFPLDRMTSGSWGNRMCIIGNFAAWPEYVPGVHPIDNEPEFPMVVWLLAQKAAA